MCSLVYVGVSGYDGNAAQPFLEYGFGTDAPTNPSCAALPGTTRMQVTAGGCSCAIYHGGGDPEPTMRRDPDAQRRRNYEKKGWSAAKIERALASSKRTHGTPQIDPRDHIGQFADALATLVRGGAQVTLLAHSFRGAFTEPFDIRGQARMPLAVYLANGHVFPEDHLVTLDR